MGELRTLEMSQFCVVQRHPVPDIRRTMAVLQNVTSAADDHRCEMILALGSPQQARFYRALGFALAAGYKMLPKLGLNIGLFSLNWSDARIRLRKNLALRDLFAPDRREL